MSVEKLVTILIVNWKTPHLLADCLDSIKQDSKFAMLKVVVVDNNSQDESVAMLKTKYPWVELEVNNQNLGFSKACNQVMTRLETPYVFLLNPDTKVEKDATSKLLDFIQTNPTIGIVGPKVLNIDGSFQLACRRSFPSPMASFFRLTYLSYLFPKNKYVAKYNLTYMDQNQICEVDSISGASMLIRKDVLDKIGFFDENIFMFGEDIDLCWRAKLAGFKVFYYPRATIYHVHGASSKKRPVGTTINLHNGMFVFYKKHLAKDYPFIFNWLIYLGIYVRMTVFIVINFLKSFV